MVGHDVSVDIQVNPPIELADFIADVCIADAGHSSVYRGRHKSTNTDVAIKLLTLDSSRAGAYQRFQHEVRSTTRIVHPGIVRLFECGLVTAEQLKSESFHPWIGRYYMVTEWLDGGCLSNHVATMTWRDVRGILLSLLDTLAVTHAHGLYHLDIKPGNVMLSQRGPVLVDFGIARAIEDFEDDDRPARPVVRGTPRYMAPEQARARWRLFGPETDLYALGCLAFCMLNGRPPFNHGDPWRIMRQQCVDPLPPLEARFNVPSGLEAWVGTLLEKHPRRRFRFAAEAARSLRELDLIDDVMMVHSFTHDIHLDGTSQTDETLLTQSEPTIVAASSFLDEWDAPVVEPESGARERPDFPISWTMPQTEADVDVQVTGLGTSIFGVSNAPFCGRDDERDRLWQELRQVYRGDGLHVMLVQGEPGSGKSALVDWMASRAHAFGVARYLSLTHQEVPGPFDGLVGMIRRFFRVQGVPDVERRAFIRSRLAVADDDPMLDALLALLATDQTYRVGGRAVLTLKTAQQRYNAVARFLAKLASDRPIILLADDVHWSLATIECLTFLIDERPELNCCIFATARRQMPRAVSTALSVCLEQAIDRQRGGYVKLGPLGRGQLAELIQSRLRLSGDTLDRLLDRADGNPLYAEQLVQHLLNRDRLESTQEGFVNRRSNQRTMPLALESLWQQRLDEALFHRDSFMAMVEIAATLGRTVAMEEWYAACAIVGVAESRTILTRLEGAELIRIDPGQGRFTFVHSLLVDSVLRRAQAGDRLISCHLTCIRVLASQRPRPLGRLAFHYGEAGDWSNAYETYLAAARVVEKQHEYVELHAHVLAAAKQLRLGGVKIRDARWARIRMLWARCRYYETHFGDALRAARRAQPHFETEPMNADHVALLDVMANASFLLFRTVERTQPHIDAYLRAAETLQDPDCLATAYWELARITMKLGLQTQCTDVLRRLEVLFETRHAELGEEFRVYTEWRLVEWKAERASYEGRHQDAQGMSARMIELAYQTGSRLELAFAHNSAGELYRLAGQYGKAIEHYQHARYWSLELSRDFAVAINSVNIALMYANQGQYDEALEQWNDVFRRLGQKNEALLDRVRPAALGVWSATGQWALWHQHIDAAISMTASGDCGIDLLDAYADACRTSWDNGASGRIFDFARQIEAALHQCDDHAMTENIARKVQVIRRVDEPKA